MSDSEIRDSHNNNSIVINDDTELNVSTEHQLYLKYHQSELDHNEKLLKHCLILVWVGVGMLVTGLIFSIITGKSQNFVLFAGVFVDLFSGGIITLVNKSADSKQRYFETISRSENEKNLIAELKSIDGEDKKVELLGKIIDAHYR